MRAILIYYICVLWIFHSASAGSNSIKREKSKGRSSDSSSSDNQPQIGRCPKLPLDIRNVEASSSGVSFLSSYASYIRETYEERLLKVRNLKSLEKTLLENKRVYDWDEQMKKNNLDRFNALWTEMLISRKELEKAIQKYQEDFYDVLTTRYRNDCPLHEFVLRPKTKETFDQMLKGDIKSGKFNLAERVSALCQAISKTYLEGSYPLVGRPYTKSEGYVEEYVFCVSDISKLPQSGFFHKGGVSQSGEDNFLSDKNVVRSEASFSLRGVSKRPYLGFGTNQMALKIGSCAESWQPDKQNLDIFLGNHNATHTVYFLGVHKGIKSKIVDFVLQTERDKRFSFSKYEPQKPNAPPTKEKKNSYWSSKCLPKPNPSK